MPKRKKDVDEEIFEANESNMESALIERDYSDRRVMILDTNVESARNSDIVLNEMLTGAKIETFSDVDAALARLLEAAEEEGGAFDTAVVDLRDPQVAISEFIKAVNNSTVVLVALAFEQLSPMDDERARAKLEPLRKLFDIEAKTIKPRS